MPMIKKRMSVGIPILKEVLLATILMKSKIDPISNMFSGVKTISNLSSVTIIRRFIGIRNSQ
jgi:hypothetical protein